MNKKARNLVMVAVLLVCMAGCGAGELVKETMDWVGSYFDNEETLTRRVVVAPFFSGIKGLEPLAQEIGSKVLAQMDKIGNVRLINPKELSDVTQRIPASVKRPLERMILAGRRLGLNTIVVGEVSDLSLKYDLSGIYGFRENTPFLRLEVDVTIIDVPTGTLLGRNSEVETLKVDDVTAEDIRIGGKAPPANKVAKLKHEIIEPVVDWIKDTLEEQRWAGYVLEVEGNKLKLSVGKDTGLPVDTVLAIYAHGPKLMTGAGWPLYMPGPKVGMVRLEKLEDRYSWAQVIPSEEPAPAKEGDKAKAPPKPGFEPGQLVRTR